MFERKHWLNGSSFLPLFHEAVETVERTITDRFDRHGELERPEPTITNTLIENLRSSLASIQSNLRDLKESRANQPAVSRFNFTVCDMQASNRDVLGADLAFIFRTQWDNEFVDRRGILLQAKRLGPISGRTQRRLNAEAMRTFGVPLEEIRNAYLENFPIPLRIPPLSRARIPWPSLSSMLGMPAGEIIIGEFLIDTDQLEELLQNVVSSYYLFYDYPIPHMTLPCMQALAVKGLVDAAPSNEIYRASVLRHGMSLTDLLVYEFVGCKIGEWNENFSQLEQIADQDRVGSIETRQGDFNVYAYDVSYVVVMDINLLASPYEPEKE